MAKGTRFSSDTEVYKHTQQSALYAHKGAGIFYPKGSFTVESEGAADAGRPILLDSTGLIDSTMIPASAPAAHAASHETGADKVQDLTAPVTIKNAGDVEIRMDTVGGSNDDCILSFYENTIYRGEIRWDGGGNLYQWWTDGFNIDIFTDVTSGDNPLMKIYGYETAVGVKYGSFRVEPSVGDFEIKSEDGAIRLLGNGNIITGAGTDGTLGTVLFITNSGYLTTYRHKIEASISATVLNNKLAFFLCSGVSTFNEVLELRNTFIQVHVDYIMRENDTQSLSLMGGATGDTARVLIFGASHTTQPGDVFIDAGNYNAPATSSIYMRVMTDGTAPILMKLSAAGVYLPSMTTAGFVKNDVTTGLLSGGNAVTKTDITSFWQGLVKDEANPTRELKVKYGSYTTASFGTGTNNTNTGISCGTIVAGGIAKIWPNGHWTYRARAWNVYASSLNIWVALDIENNGADQTYDIVWFAVYY